MTEVGIIEETPAPSKCKRCGVTVVRIKGSQLTPGRMPNWVHDWSAYERIALRPYCPLANGPLFDDQVEGIDDDPIRDGNVDGRWVEDD